MWSHVVRINVAGALLVLGHGSLAGVIKAMVREVFDHYVKT